MEQVTSSSLEQRVARLTEDQSDDSLVELRERLAALEARTRLDNQASERRNADLEGELKRTAASLLTQGAMLRHGVQDQGVKLARAREVQALAMAEIDGRLATMEKEIARLLWEVDLVRQEQAAKRGWRRAVRRLGGSWWRLVKGWFPSRSGTAPHEVRQAAGAPSVDAGATAKPVLRAQPAQVLAWKALLGRRR